MMIEFENEIAVVLYYSAAGFIISMLLYVFVVLGSMALRVICPDKEIDL